MQAAAPYRGVAFIVFPEGYEEAKIVQPGKETFDFPSATVAMHDPSILGSGFLAIVFVGEWHQISDRGLQNDFKTSVLPPLLQVTKKVAAPATVR